MANDFELCSGNGCPLAPTCYRAIWGQTKKPTYPWEIEPTDKECDKYLRREYYGG